MSPNVNNGFTEAETAQFARDGYVIVRELAATAIVGQLRAVALAHLAEPRLPVEYEADTQYPGAPVSRDAPGGRTVRRLLQAYARAPAFRAWATAPAVTVRLQQLLGAQVELSQVQAISAARRWALLLLPSSLIGGTLGALLVTQFPNAFKALVPWLILTATTLFLLQPLVTTFTKTAHRPLGKLW